MAIKEPKSCDACGVDASTENVETAKVGDYRVIRCVNARACRHRWEARARVQDRGVIEP